MSAKIHHLSDSEAQSIVDAIQIQLAKSVTSSKYPKPVDFECELSSEEIENILQQGNAAYDALDWSSVVDHFGHALDVGIVWIPLVVSRYNLALASCSSEETDEIEEMLPLALDIIANHPGDSASYLLVALLKAKDRLFSQALQWLDFGSMTNESPLIVYQHVSDTIQFRIKCYRADIDDVLPHLLKPSRLSILKEESSGIDWEIIEPSLEKIRSDHSYIEKIWENDCFISLIDLAVSQFNQYKWFLYMDEDVMPQHSDFCNVDDRTFLKIIWFIDWRDLNCLSMTCKMMSNRCKSDEARFLRETIEALDENSMFPIFAKEDGVVAALEDALLQEPSNEGTNEKLVLPTLEKLILLVRRFELVVERPLYPPARLAYDWLIWHANQNNLLCKAAFDSENRLEIQNSEIPSLCLALIDTSEYSCLPGLLYALVQFGDTIDAENSKLGCLLPEETTLLKFTPGIWHITIAQLLNPFDNEPEIGVMQLSQHETSSPELEILVGQMVTTIATYVVVIRLSEPLPKMVAKRVEMRNFRGVHFLNGLNPLD